MPAGRTRPAGVGQRYGHKQAAVPRQLVVQLAAELEPAMVEDAFVQARFGLHVFTRLLGAACRRPGHVPHLQVLDAHHRVVLADSGRGLVQIVPADVGDPGVDTLNSGFGLCPVAAEFDLAAHCPLVAAQTNLMTLEAGQRHEIAPIAHGGKTGNAYIDTDGAGCLGRWLLDFALGHEPLAARQAHRSVAQLAQHGS